MRSKPCPPKRKRPGKPTLAQALADQLAKDTPDLVRVGLHVTPPGTSENLIVASNVAEKIGQGQIPFLESLFVPVAH